MPTPFPGMDPYLEQPDLWPDVHNRLITHLADSLGPMVRPRYYVSVEERTYLVESDKDSLVGRPDVTVVEQGGTQPSPVTTVKTVIETAVEVEVPLPDEVRETYLEIRAAGTDRVVTVVEILSPSNKRPGRGRDLYEEKRLIVLGSATHLIEIDLLRSGEPMSVRGDGRHSHYRILVSRWRHRPKALLFPFTVRQPIPQFQLPLKYGDEEPIVDLNQLLHDLYDRAGYDLRIDYTKEPVPPLDEADAEWAHEILQRAGVT